MESGIRARVKAANAPSPGLLKNPPRSSFPRPETNPPYPPLTGGYKKAMRPRRVEGFCFFLPPCQGGVGGVAFTLSGAFSRRGGALMERGWMKK